MSSTPIVSVIIPAYNAANTLEDAINSVLYQSYPNVEVIVVDDGSTDNTEEVIKQYISEVTYIQKNNGGFASARNLGFRVSKGEFIAWLDSDDIFHVNKLEQQINYLFSNSEVGAVATEFSAFNEKGVIAECYMQTYYSALQSVSTPLNRLMSISDDGSTSYKGNLFDLLLHGNFLHPPTLIFRRELIEKAGPQREDLGSAADYEYIMRLAQLAPLALIEKPLLNYRISKTQDSSYANALKNWPELIRCLQVTLDWQSIKGTRREKIVKQHIREISVFLAREQANNCTSLAIKTLASSLKYGMPRFDTLLTVIKILLPRKLLRLKRKFWNKKQSM